MFQERIQPVLSGFRICRGKILDRLKVFHVFVLTIFHSETNFRQIIPFPRKVHLSQHSNNTRYDAETLQYRLGPYVAWTSLRQKALDEVVLQINSAGALVGNRNFFGGDIFRKRDEVH